MSWSPRTKPAALLVLLSSGAAGAADLPASILRCTAIPDNQARLACFDRATAAWPAPVSANPAAAAATPQSTVGAATVAEPTQQQDLLRGSVRSVERRGDGTWRLVLDDGSTWVQSDSTQEWYLSPGDQVELRKGMLGAWFVRKDGRNTALKVRPAR